MRLGMATLAESEGSSGSFKFSPDSGKLLHAHKYPPRSLPFSLALSLALSLSLSLSLPLILAYITCCSELVGG
jgi:hypothetical protein